MRQRRDISYLSDANDRGDVNSPSDGLSHLPAVRNDDRFYPDSYVPVNPFSNYLASPSKKFQESCLKLWFLRYLSAAFAR